MKGHLAAFISRVFCLDVNLSQMIDERAEQEHALR